MNHLLIFTSLYLYIYYLNYYYVKYYRNNANKILLLCVFNNTWKVIIQGSRKNIKNVNKIQKDNTYRQ